MVDIVLIFAFAKTPGNRHIYEVRTLQFIDAKRLGLNTIVNYGEGGGAHIHLQTVKLSRFQEKLFEQNWNMQNICPPITDFPAAQF